MKSMWTMTLLGLLLCAGASAQAASTACKVWVGVPCFSPLLGNQGLKPNQYVTRAGYASQNAAACLEQARALLPLCRDKLTGSSQIWAKFEVDGVGVIGAAAYASDGKTYIYTGDDSSIRWTHFKD